MSRCELPAIGVECRYVYIWLSLKSFWWNVANQPALVHNPLMMDTSINPKCNATGRRILSQNHSTSLGVDVYRKLEEVEDTFTSFNEWMILQGRGVCLLHYSKALRSSLAAVNFYSIRCRITQAGHLTLLSIT